METELRDSPEALAEIENEWRELFSRDASATPFSTPEWATAWTRHLGEGSRPWLLTAREDGRLIGLAPLVLLRRGPVRLLRPLGKEPADYWDLLAEPDRRGEIARAFAEAIELRSADWDLMVLDCLPQGSELPAALKSSSELGLRMRAPIPYPGLPLPADMETYLGGLSRKRRNKLRRHLRKVDEGTLSMGIVRDPDEVAPAIDRWFELRVRQWASNDRRIEPLQATDSFRQFIAEVTTALLPSERVVLREFRADDELVGSYLSFQDERCFYLYLGGYSADAAELELGSVNICLALRESMEAGREYFDFLAGSEPYKYWYGAADQQVEPLLVRNGRSRSRLMLQASGMRDRWRRRESGDRA